MGGSGEITNYLINLDIIEIIQFCLEIFDLWRHLHLWVGVWVVGWMGGSVGQWVGSGHITKYRINLDLIKIIKFCLKIYDLLRHPHLINPNAEPRMRYVKNVKCLATSRNAVRNLVTSQKIVLIDRISLFRQVQAE